MTKSADLLLVNALVHRDYLVSAPIRIFVFDDRIEIISPGHLPNNLTVEKIRRIYIAILSRPPDGEEMKIMTDEVKAAGEDGYRNIVSALVMSSEFLFLQ